MLAFHQIQHLLLAVTNFHWPDISQTVQFEICQVKEIHSIEIWYMFLKVMLNMTVAKVYSIKDQNYFIHTFIRHNLGNNTRGGDMQMNHRC